jgi:SAM-dependent methyltransferase
MEMSAHYCCTEPECNHAPLLEREGGLRCSKGHFVPYIGNSRIPDFACEAENANEYALKEAAIIHDNSLRWVFDTFGSDEPSLRKSLISRLRLSEGMTVLITGAGAGNDLPYIAQSLKGAGVIYAQDIAKPMLMAGVERHAAQIEKMGVTLFFSASDATNLPFADNVFDAAYHFGGLNLFPDVRLGIAEMNRVVKQGGRIVIGDEGVAPWLKQTELGAMLIKNNPLYSFDAPLSLLPDTARSVNLSWELCNTFFVIEFVVSDAPLPVNIDVPHIGRRGGSIRTRYLGQLEGIDRELRDQVYSEAEKQGISRVEYLESLIKNALGK